LFKELQETKQSINTEKWVTAVQRTI
jgi:hypothetical protein